MVQIRKLGSTKRFGPRYGKKLKTKMALVEAETRRPHQCPSCHAMKARRVSAGIWKCTKCKIVFTGKAYTTVKSAISKKEELPIEEKEVEEQEDTSGEEEVEVSRV